MLDHAYDIGVFDIKYRSREDRADQRAGGAWIADDGFVNEPNNSAGAVK